MARTLLRIGIASGGGILLAAATAVATLVYLLATTSGDRERSEGLFGAVFFETTAGPGGGTLLTAGVSDPAPLLVIAAASAIFLWLAQVIGSWLMARRSLLTEGVAPGPDGR